MTKIQLFIHRCEIIYLSLIGELIQIKLRLTQYRLSEMGVNTTEQRHKKIIISLTSYGRRLSVTAAATIYSLLRQTMKPDEVILWLDHDNWNDNNLPSPIQYLRKWGLTIRYCDDLRSYKKHVPALSLYPNDLIITVDDDFYYSKYMVERLYRTHLQHPHSIITLRAHRILFDKNGKLLPYNSWNMMQHNTCIPPLFATTGGGCLMQLSLLHSDTLNSDLFLNLCPHADDVWFYFMGVMKRTPIIVLPKWPYMMIPFDILYQKTHTGASLQEINRGTSENDLQIEAMMAHYHLSEKDLLLQ